MSLAPPDTMFVVDGVPDGGVVPPSPATLTSAPVASGVGTTPLASAPTVTASYPTNILADIRNPQLANFDLLLYMGKQASLLTAAFDQPEMAGITAARPSPKPMVIGFIPPDIPINYIPVTQAKAALSPILNATPNPPAGAKGKGLPGSGAGSGSGPPGLQPKTTTTFGAGDLRDSIARSFRSITGRDPTPLQLALMYSQFCLESGTYIGASTFSCSNFNLGNFHSGGGTTFYDPKDGLPPPHPDAPKGGSYFWTTDTDSKGRPYGCYMQSFGSLDAATRSQVGQLIGRWPGTATATTVEEYNNALLPVSRGGTNPVSYSYYEADPSVYLSGLNARVAAYGSSPAGRGTAATGTTVTATEAPAASGSDSGPTSGSPNGNIMVNGDTTGATSDPLDYTYGRNLKVDGARKEITDAYISSIQADIALVRLTPPLLMLVNPESFERSYEQSVDSSPKGRQGHIVHLWIEKPMSISCKGRTAGQYAVGPDGSGGLTSLNRVQSLSYQNLMSLVMTYRNNGLVFDNFSQASGSLGVPVIQMSLYIYYDNRIYIGTFDDFSVDDSADKPYNMDYSFKFNVRYEVEVDSNSASDAAITSGFVGKYADVSLTPVGSQQNQPTVQTNLVANPPIPEAGTL